MSTCTVYRHTDGHICGQPLDDHGPRHFPPLRPAFPSTPGAMDVRAAIPGGPFGIDTDCGWDTEVVA